MSLFKTRGIVLRTVKYGETSVIAAVYTELFGLQSYLINGIRTEQRKASAKANLLQPGAILDMVVYHQSSKNLQRIKEFKWGTIYQHIYFNITKNAACLFAIELLIKTLSQPEPNDDLYWFIENSLVYLDREDEWFTANFPIYFSLYLMHYYGFSLLHYSEKPNHYFDLREGSFVEEHPVHPHFLSPGITRYLIELIAVKQPNLIGTVKMTREIRAELLSGIQQFFNLHYNDFGQMKTLTVLKDVFR